MGDIYLEFVKKAFKSNFAYRANSYIYILTGFLEILVQISVWYALIPKGGAIDGVSFSDMVNFVIINRLVNSMVRTSMGDTLAARIRDGSVATDFIRPIKLKYFLISKSLGDNLFWTIFSTFPVCVVSSIFFRFSLPKDYLQLLLFLISIIAGVILSYSINYLLGLLVFWLKTGLHIRWVLRACNNLFAGSVVPIWFYPGALFSLSMLLPFRLISFESISIYIGKTPPKQAINVILIQFAWIIGLWLLEKIIWQKAQKNVTVQGG